MTWLDRLVDFWPHVVGSLTLFIAALTSGHALLHKRDSRAAALWVLFIWFVPLLGAVLYLSFGINRIRRRAVAIRGAAERSAAVPDAAGNFSLGAAEVLPPEATHLRTLAQLVGRVVGRPLIRGNKIEPLVNGDAAYPAMLAAIKSAERSISLVTYIFDNDRSGRRFVDALGEAVRRGVQVRVLIDDAGARYSLPSIVHPLRHARVPVARFLPTLAPWRLMTMNLRNHRKIMVVDGRVGFTGGMNLREGNLVAEHPRSPVQDLHFRLEGPAVAQLQEIFVGDWAFATNETLSGESWFPSLSPVGTVIARAIPDGPDEDFEKLRLTILGALACAETSVQILTPYFLPDPAIVSALNVAALRGVRVDIILPALSNLPFVHWASRAMWWQVLRRGCRIWLTPPPFDHSKLMVVDGQWALVGSANWDARSLRLNFEFNLECYDRELALRLEVLLRQKLAGAKEITLAEIDSRRLPERLRDGSARLLTPYL
ncbi:MAG TPA: cardiolipin synthase [Candidatus Acidoferrum sp.]|jgi:cardiolipin synthase|nr:cardiolipin synthase [Candidatus Acidoferrum sp.]